MKADEILTAFEQLPLKLPGEILAPGPLLVLAPHPDDESLGCGGLIALTAAEGRDVHVVVLTDGSGSHPQSPSTPPDRLRAIREDEAREAVSRLGLPPGRLSFLRQPDAHAPHEGAAFDAVAASLVAFVRDHGIATICTTWRHDPHCDHEAAAKLCDAVARETGARLLAFPVWGWTLPADHALPDMRAVGARIDISSVLARKRRAIAAHASQTTRMIDDSPCGFQLPPEFIALFERPWETYVAA